MADLLIVAVVLSVLGLFYWSGYRDSQTEEKYKYTDRKGNKWVP